MYNLVRRQVEVEIFPLAQAENIGVVTFSPLAAGLLTGKYSQDTRPTQGRIVENQRYAARYSLQTDFETATRFASYAASNNVTPATLAVAWTMSHPAVTAPIIGARSVDQLKDSLAAIDFDMSSTMRDEISALSPTPPPATDRTETQKGNWV